LEDGKDEANALLSLVSEYASSTDSSPKEPTGGEAYIAQLERQRDQLIARQRRLAKSVKDIEACLPPNPSTHNYTQRAHLKAELRNLQSEYDGISKDLYEKGLLLHRAWRRRDTKMGLEPPAVLWVRRVSENQKLSSGMRSPWFYFLKQKSPKKIAILFFSFWFAKEMI